MARVLLVMPRLPQRMGTPYLGQQYLASALLADGHEVRVLDLAATHAPPTEDDLLDEVARWQPHVLGMTLFTYNALRGYQLARRMAGKGPLLVAGGAHVTALPAEALEHGFDVAVAGEGEHALVAIARHVDHGAPALDEIPGVFFQGGQGPARQALEDLDALPFPLHAQPLWDPRWYHPSAPAVPGGMTTSRGCPARCTFCANYVTGRVYRWRSAANVVAEMVALCEAHGLRHVAFWDDAFTARRDRLEALCDAIEDEPALSGVTWTAITPANMVRPRDLSRMRRAGCLAINFGIESGAPGVLASIRKGQRPDRLVESVQAANAEGMTTIVNFMFGFPGEGLAELRATRALMERLAPFTTFFNNRGVLVPFPATQIYDQWADEYDLHRWWLDESRVVDEPNMHVLDPTTAQEYLEIDPTLALDFFRYDDAVREEIAACVRFKGRHNQRTMVRGPSIVAA